MSPNQHEGHGCNAAGVQAIALATATYSLFAPASLARCFGTNLLKTFTARVDQANAGSVPAKRVGVQYKT